MSTNDDEVISDPAELLLLAEQQIEELEAEIERKKDIIKSMRNILQDTEDQADELRKENSRLKEKIQELQNNSRPKVATDDDEEDDEDSDISGKIRRFLTTECIVQDAKNGSQEKIPLARLRALVINILASFHHLQYDKSVMDDMPITPSLQEMRVQDYSNIAVKIAFSYALEFFRQCNDRKSAAAESSDFDESFPFLWLMGMYPFNLNRDMATPTASKDTAWLPLHIFLGVDSAQLPPNTNYLDHLEVLLQEYGQAAFQEEVSPLSIAVAKHYPNVDVVQSIVSFYPKSTLQEDDDGCIPLMHACSNNFTTDVIQFLTHQNPDSLDMSDNFGCSAIHYATFSGCARTVEFLLRMKPQLAVKKEGNGALPLHDAVQNRRGIEEQLQITNLLLQVYPAAATQRDDYGALPLHNATKSSSLEVVKAIYNIFPAAIFAADSEGLLPLHYFSQRKDKNDHIDIMEFLVEKNAMAESLPENKFQQKVKEVLLKLPKQPIPLPPAPQTNSSPTPSNIKSMNNQPFSSGGHHHVPHNLHAGMNTMNINSGGGNSPPKPAGSRRKSVVSRRSSNMHAQYRHK